MKGFLSIVTSNLLGFDMIIFIVAICNGIVCYLTAKAAGELYKKMHLTVYVPDSEDSALQAERELTRLSETEIVAMRKRTAGLYSVFVNITGIFPLLGILGTVISLLSLVEDMSNVQGNFYGALTSTFWGLVFAIIFKLLDGSLSAKIEDNEQSVRLYLERNSVNKAEKAE